MFLRELMRFRQAFLSTLLLTVTVLLTALVGEIAVRLLHRDGPLTFDEELGWKPRENYRFDGFHKAADGTQYPVHISQNEYGFRMFGDVRTKRPKIMVIGDSYTHAIQVSDDKTYYAYLKKYLDAEVFAYGGDGYGTLQEYMVLDRFFDRIKPDLILWQYCGNDFINNSVELEQESSINNNGLVRPYWVNGRITYLLPKKHGSSLRRLALKYSRLLYLVMSRLDKVFAHLPIDTVEAQISSEGSAHPGFAHSVQVTDALMSKVRARVGQMPVVAFIVGGGHAVDTFRHISSRHGIQLLDDVQGAIENAEGKGIVVKSEDRAHWNETGHRIAGEVLAANLM